MFWNCRDSGENDVWGLKIFLVEFRTSCVYYLLLKTLSGHIIRYELFIQQTQKLGEQQAIEGNVMQDTELKTLKLYIIATLSARKSRITFHNMLCVGWYGEIH